MTKYTVCLQQYVERLATVEIEASSPEEARQIAFHDDAEAHAEWMDGDDAYRVDIWAVMHNGAVVWER